MLEAFLLVCCCHLLLDDKPRLTIEPSDAHQGITRMRERLDSRFDKLQKAYENYLLSRQQNGNRPDSRATQAKEDYLKQVAELLTREELVECLAFAVCRNGYMSFGQSAIVDYLSLTNEQQTAVKKAIAHFQKEMEAAVEAHGNLQASHTDAIANQLIKDKLPLFMTAILRAIPPSVEFKVKRLVSQSDMNDVVLRAVKKRVHEAILNRMSLESIRKKPLNIRQYFTANLLVIGDQPEFHQLLKLSNEQTEKMTQLHNKYDDQLNHLQALYLEELQKAKKDPTAFFSEIAIKLNRESGPPMLQFLNEKQKKRLLQIKAQMYGTDFAFHHEVAPRIGITDEQQSELLRYLMKIKKDNLPLFDQWKKQPDGAFISRRFISKQLFDNYFDDSQREKWKTFIGEVIQEDTLKKLSILQFQRTRLLY